MERRKITRQFKVETVNLVKDPGVAMAQASRDLGIRVNVLRLWVKDFSGDTIQAFQGHEQMKPEGAEIARLKLEVTKLKTERDILKASAYFTKEIL